MNQNQFTHSTRKKIEFKEELFEGEKNKTKAYTFIRAVGN